MKTFNLILFLFLAFVGGALAQTGTNDLKVKLKLPADASGEVPFDILVSATDRVVTNLYRVDEGIVDIYMGAEYTGTLEITPNTNKLYIGDLQPGETLKIKSMKLVNLVKAEYVYLTDLDIPLDNK